MTINFQAADPSDSHLQTAKQSEGALLVTEVDDIEKAGCLLRATRELRREQPAKQKLAKNDIA